MHRLLVALKSVQSLIWVDKQCFYIDNYDFKVLGLYMSAFWSYFHLSQIKETNLFVPFGCFQWVYPYFHLLSPWWVVLSFLSLHFLFFLLFDFLVRNSPSWLSSSWYLQISVDHPRGKTNKGLSDRSFLPRNTVWAYSHGLCSHSIGNCGSPSL